MLNDTIVVQSAVSAFNNAALVAPAFLWWAILAMPLFVGAYLCADLVRARIGWNSDNAQRRMALWSMGLTFGWVVLFGGNYDVLRDSLSALPFMNAVIVFLTSLFVASHTRNVALPKRNVKNVLLALAIILVVALSDLHAWWGPLLQVGAMLLGGLLGRVAKADMRPIAGAVLITMTVVTAMLMQPEFFRFGQLGNLTIIHLIAVLALGGVGMALLALNNVNPRGKIKRSVFIKLKWMMRFIVALGVALFVLTEAVPIFLGTMATMFVMFAMSVWHAERVASGLVPWMFAILLGIFGVLTVMPVITVMAILYASGLERVDLWAKSKFLL